MAHRKRIENWLETTCKHWGDEVELQLIHVDNDSYVWHLIHQNNVYEITYGDIGEITLSSLPSKYWPGSFIREIYSGDNSVESYNKMMAVLTDNFVDVV
jgi:hypothetical protein